MAGYGEEVRFSIENRATRDKQQLEQVIKSHMEILEEFIQSLSNQLGKGNAHGIRDKAASIRILAHNIELKANILSYIIDRVEDER